MTHQRSSSVFAWLQTEVKPAVDERIDAAIADWKYPEPLEYQIRAGGKRLRPGLALSIGPLCGLEKREVLDVAAGVELLHTFTLIHDDVMDADRYRRGEPTVWAEYGTASAINFGDMAFAHALRLFPDEHRSRAIDASLRMAEGQQMDLEFSRRRDVTVEEYEEMVRRKTGSLFELCLSVPQEMAGVDLGIDGYGALWPAFQIRDDLLDFEPGKGRDEPGSDVREGKRSLMVVHADDDRIYDILDAPAESTTAEDVREVESLLAEHGSFEFARREMRRRGEEALAALDGLPDSRERRRLAELGRFLLDRDR